MKFKFIFNLKDAESILFKKKSKGYVRVPPTYWGIIFPTPQAQHPPSSPRQENRQQPLQPGC